MRLKLTQSVAIACAPNILREETLQRGGLGKAASLQNFALPSLRSIGRLRDKHLLQIWILKINNDRPGQCTTSWGGGVVWSILGIVLTFGGPSTPLGLPLYIYICTLYIIDKPSNPNC